MDRIKKALDLARSQWAEDVEPAPVRPAEFSVRRPPEPAARPVRAQTRIVAVDAAVTQRNRVLAPGATDMAAQSYKILRTQVLQRMKLAGLHTLAIVSPGPDDGKTLTAVNLAISIADDPDHTALLVDMDLRRPSVHQRFGLSVQHGVEECLHGRGAVGDLLLQPQGYPKLVLLPASGPVQQPSELLAGEQARQLIGELAERYANRVVVFDLPPLLATDDALALLPRVDAALLVVCEGRTRREDVARSLELIRNTTVIGTVLNASREPATAYH